ncbi:hypothetical protein DPMN_094129 [Dreissena polymorpha]|uniref:Uncharacterized protein n=1 Tax=Dreissena polymorpha TaxID=45954 RepID=A0A9D4L478_DREPO|nr:hypothetical protein DPMN_094129 [Dreissena polymorpha]
MDQTILEVQFAAYRGTLNYPHGRAGPPPPWPPVNADLFSSAMKTCLGTSWHLITDQTLEGPGADKLHKIKSWCTTPYSVSGGWWSD